MNELESGWLRFERRPFPSGWAGQEVAGVALAELDAVAAGCISIFIGNRGRLDPQRLAILQSCASDLEAVVPRLTGEAQEYFAQLHDLGHQVLNLSQTRGGR